MINSIVDRVFLITTLNSNRFEYISNHLKCNDIEYDIHIAPEYTILSKEIKVKDSGIEECRPALSLLSSYVSIIEKSKLLKYDKICIIEDDCYFVQNWQSKFKYFYDNIDRCWDILNLGYHPMQEIYTLKKDYNNFAYIPTNHHFTTHCMLINNNIFNTFLKINKDMLYSIPADYIFIELYKNEKIKSFVPIEKIAWQLSVRDDFKYDIPDIKIKRFESLLV